MIHQIRQFPLPNVMLYGSWFYSINKVHKVPSCHQIRLSVTIAIRLACGISISLIVEYAGTMSVNAYKQ